MSYEDDREAHMQNEADIGDEMVAAEPTFDEQQTAAVDLVYDNPGVEHIWLNAFSCIRPTDAFAAEVGRTVIAKVMAHKNQDVLKSRHIVLRINAS